MRPWYNKPDRRLYVAATEGLTPAVRMLLMVTVGVFFLQWILDASLYPILRSLVGVENTQEIFKTLFGYSRVDAPFTTMFSASRASLYRGFFWGPVTYLFLHSTTRLFHIVLNMLVLYFLGPETERGLGSQRFLILYFLSGILGALGWLLVNPSGSCIGASGAIFGVLGAFAMLYPQRQLTLLLFFIIPINMRAWVMACFMGGVELVMLITGPSGTIAHGVHLAGGVAGLVYTWVLLRTGRLKRIPEFAYGMPPPPLPGQERPRSPFHFPRPAWFRPGYREADAAEVDRILDKIADQGLGSLSNRERKTLQSRARNGRGR